MTWLQVDLMSSLRCRFLVACFAWSLLPVAGRFASAADNLRDEWVDSETGHRVVRLSRLPGSSSSFYFHQNAFTAEGDKMVF